MMKKPTDNEILLAEQRLNRARKEVVESADRVRIEIHDALARPSTLLGVAVAAGLLGYWLFKPARRLKRPARRVQARRSEDRAATETSNSLVGILVAFAMRYAMQRLPAVGMQLVEKALHGKDKSAVPPKTLGGVPDPLVSARPATATLH